MNKKTSVLAWLLSLTMLATSFSSLSVTSLKAASVEGGEQNPPTAEVTAGAEEEPSAVPSPSEDVGLGSEPGTKASSEEASNSDEPSWTDEGLAEKAVSSTLTPETGETAPDSPSAPDGQAASEPEQGAPLVGAGARAEQGSLRFAEGDVMVQGQLQHGYVVEGWVAGQESQTLTIPAAYLDLPVLAVADRAFVGSELTALTLPESLVEIGEQAFAANKIASLDLPQRLERVGQEAFRDNALTSLQLAKVKDIGSRAFANNQLQTVDLQGVVTVGEEAFRGNQLSEVAIPDSLEALGPHAFTYNGRYVLLTGENPLVKSEKQAGAFGQVAHPVDLIVHFVDAETGAAILNDRLEGSDFWTENGVAELGETQTYTAPAIDGYDPVEANVTYTPDRERYELTIRYNKRESALLLEAVGEAKIQLGAEVSRDLLLSFVRASNGQGKDLKSQVRMTPETIDSNEAGVHEILYSLEDANGNLRTLKRSVWVTADPDWLNFPLGEGWVLGDFVYGKESYNKTEVLGFTDQGKAKLSRNKDLILPHINPYDPSVEITRIGWGMKWGINQKNGFSGIEAKDIRDYNSNIQYINGTFTVKEADSLTLDGLVSNYSGYALVNSHIGHVKLNSLKSAGNEAFRGLRARIIELNGLERLSNRAIGGLQATERLELRSVKSIKKIYLNSTDTQGEIFLDSLEEVEEFYLAPKVKRIHAPKLKRIGNSAFFDTTILTVEDEDFISVETVEGDPFRWSPNDYFYWPHLKSISQNAFTERGFIFRRASRPVSLDDYAKRAVIITDKSRIFPPTANYVVDPEDGEIDANAPFGEDDFLYEDESKRKLIGLSKQGWRKIDERDYTTRLKIQLPDSVEEIGDKAFYDLWQSGLPNSFDELYVEGQNVRQLGQYAFSSSHLRGYDFPNLKVLKRYSLPSTMPEGNAPGFDLRGVEIIEYDAFGSYSNYDPAKRSDQQMLAIHGETFTFDSLREARVSAMGSSLSVYRLYLPAIERIDARAFGLQRMAEVYVGENLESLDSRAFTGGGSGYNPGYNGAITNPYGTTLVFTPDRQNPHNLQDGYGHVVNPTEVTIHYVDEKGQTLLPDRKQYRLPDNVLKKQGKPKEIIAPSIFGYTPKQVKYDIPDDRQVHDLTIVYTKAEQGVEGALVNQWNEEDRNAQNKPKELYEIGEQMRTWHYIDLTGYGSSIEGAVLKIYYDPKYVVASDITVPRSDAIAKYEAKDGVLSIYLQSNKNGGDIVGGQQLEIPIYWRFKKLQTPDLYKMQLNMDLRDEHDKIYATSQPIYLQGWYKKPSMSKNSPLNLPGYDYRDLTSADHAPRRLGELGIVNRPDGSYDYAVIKDEPVSFYFAIHDLARYVDKSVIKDVLPTYTALNDIGEEETRVAVFNPEENPDWHLSEDKKSVWTEVQHPATRMPSAYYPELKLRFPRALSGDNIENHAEIELFPYEQGELENTMRVSDDITIYQVLYKDKKPPKGEVYFDKSTERLPRFDGKNTYFFDTDEDRKKDLPFRIEVTAENRTITMRDVVVTDYDLDKKHSRLKYTGVSVQEGSTDETVSVVAYHKKGELMNPAEDQILETQRMQARKWQRIRFSSAVQDQIDYIQIIFRPDYALEGRLLFDVHTALREPGQSQYSSERENFYDNEALLTANLFGKETGLPASDRSKPLLTADGEVVTQDTPDWAHLPGNFIWWDKDIIHVRGFRMEMGIEKKQSYPSDRSVMPGDTGRYDLKLTPYLEGSRDARLGRDGVKEDLANFEMIDILPRGILVNAVHPTSDFIRSGGTYELVENYQGKGQEAVIFKADVLASGVFDIASIETSVEPNVSEGHVTNHVYGTWEYDGITKVGQKIAPPGVDDGREWLHDQASISVIKVCELTARKYIRREGGPWSMTGVKTPAGSAFDYRLSLFNGSSSERSAIDLVDVFPYLGDESIQELRPGSGQRPAKKSQFSNTLDLTREIQILRDDEDVKASFDIRYENGTGKIKEEIRGSADEAIEKLNWETTPQATSRAIRITAKPGFELKKNQQLDVIIPMKAPEDGNRLMGLKAYNTYVRKDAQTVRFLEPNRVYNEIPYPKGILEFTKKGYDEETKTSSNLAGVEFQLYKYYYYNYRWQEEYIQTAVSDENGLVRFSAFDLNPRGQYRIKETKAPKGYIGVGPQDFYGSSFKPIPGQLEDGVQVYKYVAEDFRFENRKPEKPIVGSLRVEKLINTPDGRVPGAVLQFHLQGKNKQGEVVYERDFFTNQEGRFEVDNLPAASYVLKEVAPAGQGHFIPVSQHFEIKKAPGRSEVGYTKHYFTANNGSALINYNYSLLITKLGVKDASLLDDISELNNIGQKGLGGYKFVLKGDDGSTIKTAATDTYGSQKGSVEVTVKPGVTYEIQEIETPYKNNYIHNTKSYRFKVGNDGALYTPEGKRFVQPFNLNFPNLEKPLKARVKVVKESNGGLPLPGAKFGLFQAQAEGEPLLIAEGTSQIEGKEAVVYFNDLKAGVYQLRELEAPLGYVRDERSVTVTIPERLPEYLSKDKNGLTYEDGPEEVLATFEHVFVNKSIQAEIIKGSTLQENLSEQRANWLLAEHPEWRKRQVAPGLWSVYQPLAGVKFVLDEIKDGERRRVSELESDADGQIHVPISRANMESVYELTEVQAAPGYRLDPTPLSVCLADEIRLTSWDGTLRRYKDNRPNKGRILLSKYELDTRQTLAGASFGLYAETAEGTGPAAWPLKVVKSDANGFVEFANLDFGRYYVRELEAPVGYQRLEKTWVFDLSEEASQDVQHAVAFNGKPLSLPVEKVWVGGGEEPEAISFKLFTDEALTKPAVDIDGQLVPPLVLRAEDNWRDPKAALEKDPVTGAERHGAARFENLPRYDQQGQLIHYYIQEEAILDEDGQPRFEPTITGDDKGYLVVNTNIEKRSILVRKRWVGQAADGVEVQLLANGKPVGDTVTLSPESQPKPWTHIFENLPRYSPDGQAISYQVVERAVLQGEKRIEVEDGGVSADGRYRGEVQEVSQGSFELTNKEYTRIPVSKVWQGKAGEKAAFELYRRLEGEAEELKQKVAELVLTAEQNWQGAFEDLPTVDEETGLAYVYEVQEIAQEGYASRISGNSADGYVVTNVELLNIPVEKRWLGTVQSMATIELLANGEPTGQLLELNAANQWRGVFEGLPAFDEAGQAVTYTVREQAPQTAYTLLEAKEEPASEAETQAEGVAMTAKPQVELEQQDKAQAEKQDKARAEKQGGKQDEQQGEKGSQLPQYAVTIEGDQDNGFVVTNTEFLSIPVEKQWVGKALESVKIRLLANGQATEQILELTADTKWQGVFASLPAFDEQGKPIVYSVEELDLDPRYKVSITGQAHGGFVVTNSEIPTTPPPTNIPRTGQSWPGMPKALALLWAGAACCLFRLSRREEPEEGEKVG